MLRLGKMISCEVVLRVHSHWRSLNYTNKAVDSARAARKKRWICFILCLVILIIIAIVVVIFVMKNKN